MTSSANWLDIIRREALNVHFHGQTKSTLVCTSYNPKTHSVKGILVPHGVETGWIPVATQAAGKNWGVMVGPTPGDPQKLDGEQFDVDFEFGDPNTPIARHRLHSTPDTPPEVKSGEILLQHQKGHKLYFAEDGSVTLYHAAHGGTLAFDKDGNLSADTKNQSLSLTAGSGKVAINGIVDINS
jgi:uncharacterized protein involved in type VI secretion and phage assembly